MFVIGYNGFNLTNSFNWTLNLKKGVFLHFFPRFIHRILMALLMFLRFLTFILNTLCGTTERFVFILDIGKIILTLRLGSIRPNFYACVFFFFNLDKLSSETFFVAQAKFCDVAWRLEILNELLLRDINRKLGFFVNIVIIVFNFIIIHLFKIFKINNSRII